MPPSDTDILNALEAANPGLRAHVAQTLEAQPATSSPTACGLCATPLDLGCPHVTRISERTSMRQLVERRCRNCSHTWLQPAKRGACPACYSYDVVNLTVRQCNLPRS
jgi:hypothetical protein